MAKWSVHGLHQRGPSRVIEQRRVEHRRIVLSKPEPFKKLRLLSAVWVLTGKEVSLYLCALNNGTPSPVSHCQSFRADSRWHFDPIGEPRLAVVICWTTCSPVLPLSARSPLPSSSFSPSASS